MIDINFLRPNKGGDITPYAQSIALRSQLRPSPSSSASLPPPTQSNPLHTIIALDISLRSLLANSSALKTTRAALQRSVKEIVKSASTQDATSAQTLTDLKTQLKDKAMVISQQDAELKVKRAELGSLLRTGEIQSS